MPDSINTASAIPSRSLDYRLVLGQLELPKACSRNYYALYSTAGNNFFTGKEARRREC